MEIDNYIRKLAKKNNILNQFIASKEINGIKFFINEIDFSRLQDLFLSYLYFYHSLYQDIYSKKVSEKVMNDIIYEDAYAYYKSKHEESIDKKTKGKKALQAVFSKTNEIKFPDKKEENSFKEI